jgi:hypothetical protein
LIFFSLTPPPQFSKTPVINEGKIEYFTYVVRVCGIFHDTTNLPEALGIDGIVDTLQAHFAVISGYFALGVSENTTSCSPDDIIDP